MFTELLLQYIGLYPKKQQVTQVYYFNMGLLKF